MDRETIHGESRSRISRYYFASFLWIICFLSIFVSSRLISELILFDFIHTNPHRSQQNAAAMMLIFPPVLSLIFSIGAVLVFGLSQILQAVIVRTLISYIGTSARFAIFPAIPMLALVTWFSFDHFIPHDFGLGINEGPEWEAYRHGLTWSRYLEALAAQAPVTLFSFLYAEACFRGWKLRWLLLIPALVATTAGAIHGHETAQQQIRLQAPAGLHQRP